MNDLNYDKLKDALKRLQARYADYLQHKDQLPTYLVESVKESCIQRFEVCFDTTWKHLKKYLESVEGLQDVPGSPNGVIKKAFVARVLDNPELWIGFNLQRSATSHDYSGHKADQAFAVIEQFIPEAIALLEKMSGEVWQS